MSSYASRGTRVANPGMSCRLLRAASHSRILFARTHAESDGEKTARSSRRKKAASSTLKGSRGATRLSTEGTPSTESPLRTTVNFASCSGSASGSVTVTVVSPSGRTM